MKQKPGRYKYPMMLIVCSFLAVANVWAQSEISGKVTDAKGETLIGVTVVVKGTTTGTVTDLDGNYKMPVADKNAVLVFSYVGFQSEEVPLEGRNSVDITLKESTKILNEVVVVGCNPMCIYRKERNSR